MSDASRHAERADSAPRNGGRPSPRALALEATPLGELERIFLDGRTPDVDLLAGWEFRGINTPRWIGLLGIRQFIKGFVWRGADLYGYNTPVRQAGFHAPWSAKPSDASSKRFGWYRVTAVDPTARDNYYLHALLLDYGGGGNPRFDPTGRLRDYLVQVEADNPDLYLGKAYLAVGPIRVPTWSFFVLERHRPAAG